MAILFQIIKRESGNWEHQQLPSEDFKPFEIGKFYCKSDGDYFKLTEQGGSRRLITAPPNIGFRYDEIELIVEGTPETFASITDLMDRLYELVYPGFDYPEAAGGTTYIEDGTNTTVTGDGTLGNPYQINASGGGSIVQDNIFKDTILIGVTGVPTADSIAAALNALDPFTIQPTELFLFLTFGIVDGNIYPVLYRTVLLNKGAGTYGTGGTEIQPQDIGLVSLIAANLTLLEAEADIIDLGEIGATPVHEALNAEDPAREIQSQSFGATIIKVLVDDVEKNYWFLGPAGTYGVGELESTAEMFYLLGNEFASAETLQTVASRGNVFANENEVTILGYAAIALTNLLNGNGLSFETNGSKALVRFSWGPKSLTITPDVMGSNTKLLPPQIADDQTERMVVRVGGVAPDETGNVPLVDLPFIPLSGTEVGSPVTGTIVSDVPIVDSFNDNFVANPNGTITTKIVTSDDGFSFIRVIDNELGTTTDYKTTSIDQTDGDGNYRTIVFGTGVGDRLRVFVATGSGHVDGVSIDGRGFSGQWDYSQNITDLDYTQKKYVDDAIAAATIGEGAVQGDIVADIAARDAYDVPALPFTLYVEDDGDANWALYMATSTGVGASFNKISDPDLLNAVMSNAAVKTAYESNANTNAFTDAEKSKLGAVASGATANQTDSHLKDRTNHTGTQSADTITDGTTNKAYTATEKTKLTGIATGATANDTDANLKNRANHTGSQAISTITNLQSSLDALKGSIMVLQSDYGLANSTSLQKIFNVGSSGSGSFPVAANSVYNFELNFEITNLNGGSSTYGFGFLGTATYTKIAINSYSKRGTTITAVANSSEGFIDAETGIVVSASLNTANAVGILRGTIITNGAGTLIPAVIFSLGMTGVSMMKGTMCRLIPIGGSGFTATADIV